MPSILTKTYLHHLEVVKLGYTYGDDTLETAEKAFKAGFASNFEKYGIVFSGCAPETSISVDELIEDGKFPDFLGNTSEELESRRMLGSQWLKLCREHSFRLFKRGNSSFFVLTKNDEKVVIDTSNVLVACVYVLEDRELSSCLFKFNNNMNWNSEYRHRIFYPQR